MTERQHTNAGEGLIKDRYELILREFQNLVSFGYLLLVILGMLFESIYYYHFGINIFEYSSVLDFLLAPFRRPVTIIFMLIALGSASIGYALDVWTEKRLPRLHNFLNLGLARKPLFKRVRLAGIVVVFGLLTIFYAFLIGKEAREHINKDFKPDMQVELHSQTTPLVGYKVGMNGSYLFLADSTAQLLILPIDSNIKSLVPTSPRN